jgi:hypothetical protein
MPLYELVLQFPDAREETRFTDRAVAVGDMLSIADQRWEVVASTIARSPHEMRVTAAFLCELTREQRARAVEMRLEDDERHFRVAERARRRRSKHA